VSIEREWMDSLARDVDAILANPERYAPHIVEAARRLADPEAKGEVMIRPEVEA
jgi:hypothetical protein